MLSYSLAKTNVETSRLEIMNCSIGQITIRLLVVSHVVDGGDFVVDTPALLFFFRWPGLAPAQVSANDANWLTTVSFP